MKKRIYVFGLLLLSYLVSGCGGVEPEKRAYPLVIGVDLENDRYQVVYGMADLAVSTGQEKSGGDSGEGKNTVLFEGENMQEILQIYNRTQKYYLDMGHVQAVVFGEKLTGDEKRYEEILEYLEQDPVIGDGAAVFVSREPGKVLKLNGGDMESLGTYLTGIYENRPDDERRKMITLQDLYRSWHDGKGLPELPNLDVTEDFPEISA